jgi:hypothetical protein
VRTHQCVAEFYHRICKGQVKLLSLPKCRPTAKSAEGIRALRLSYRAHLGQAGRQRLVWLAMSRAKSPRGIVLGIKYQTHGLGLFFMKNAFSIYQNQNFPGESKKLSSRSTALFRRSTMLYNCVPGAPN